MPGISCPHFFNQYFYLPEIFSGRLKNVREKPWIKSSIFVPISTFIQLFMLIVVVILSFFKCFITTAAGWFLKPWFRAKKVMRKFWNIYASDGNEASRNAKLSHKNRSDEESILYMKNTDAFLITLSSVILFLIQSCGSHVGTEAFSFALPHRQLPWRSLKLET